MGKKIILTERLREQWLDLTRQGMPVRLICDTVGVSTMVYYRWLDEHDTFLEECQRARQEMLSSLKTDAEACILSKIEKRETDSWRAGAWFLSHKHPAEYAERRIQDSNQNLSAPFDRLLDAIAKRDETDNETEKKQ